jgi:hypothetical protein
VAGLVGVGGRLTQIMQSGTVPRKSGSRIGGAKRGKMHPVSELASEPWAPCVATARDEP